MTASDAPAPLLPIASSMEEHLFPRLTDPQIDRIAAHGHRRPVEY